MEVTHIGRTITKNAIQPCGWSSTAPPRAKSVHHAGSIVVLRALIVMFIAAPLLMKTIWRVRSEGTSMGQAFRGWGA